MTKLCAGDWVEVRSKEEILLTLDKSGRLENMPFMPQMFDYCGKRFRVYKRAHKTCDTVDSFTGRRLADGVHLNLRCDGKAYGGCQAACLIFWKEAWLKRVDIAESSKESMASLLASGPSAVNLAVNGNVCTEADVSNATSAADRGAKGGKRYFCQATELLLYTTPLYWYDLRQYWEDFSSGNVALMQIFCGLVYACYYWGGLCHEKRLGAPSRWLYDRAQRLLGGLPFPRKCGRVPEGRRTPTATLNLQPGELVRVKSYDDILMTVDRRNNNRGLYFDAELVPYCGGTYRVKARVQKFLNEKTGRLSELKTPAVILENVWCRSRYSACRMNCPRSIHSWWRESWLERVDPNEQRSNG